MLGVGPPPAFGFETNAARPFLFGKASEQERHTARENWRGRTFGEVPPAPAPPTAALLLQPRLAAEGDEEPKGPWEF